MSTNRAAIIWHSWSAAFFLFVVITTLVRTESGLEALYTATLLIYFWLLGGCCATTAHGIGEKTCE
jgi:hypothetical protein